ncbi:MAG: hypothetical protein C0598_01080 [Marinilabiliales bacterium]|nr:MAG: hypothetical protein C0598_01080 [Marinilabiliales bacterium]
MSKLIRFIFIAVVASLFVFSNEACLKSKKPGIPQEVVSIINISGHNKPQINRFILNAMESKDSLKLHASYFIVENLHKNYTAFYSFKDSLNNTYNIKPEEFRSLQEIQEHIKYLEGNYGKIDYKADSFSIDFRSLNSQFLTENLMHAFSTYYQNKSYLNYDFHTFLHYILPYRVANETVESFRAKLSSIYYLDTTLSFKENIKNINDQINAKLKYDLRYSRSVENYSIDSILKMDKTNMETLNIFKVKVFRSLGIAAAMDYTPALANEYGSYYWTVVFSPLGERIELDNNTGELEYNLQNSISKVYRRSFTHDTTSLFAIKKTEESTPPFLGHFNNIDVSNKYGFKALYTPSENTEKKYLYLAVYNDRNWRPVAWSVNNNYKFDFKDLAEEIVYLPVLWENNSGTAIDYPFILKNDKLIKLQPLTKKEKYTLTHFSTKEKLVKNEAYKIYYWDSQWMISKRFVKKSKGEKIVLPSNTIYKIVPENDIFNESTFLIENGQIKFLNNK